MVINKKKVFVLGLDSIPPELLFDKWLDQLPNIKRLVSNSIYGAMKSTIPAITCPAWVSMMTSANPGRLGLYGFRNRLSYDYEGLSFANSNTIHQDTVWDILSKIGKIFNSPEVFLRASPRVYQNWLEEFLPQVDRWIILSLFFLNLFRLLRVPACRVFVRFPK